MTKTLLRLLVVAVLIAGVAGCPSQEAYEVEEPAMDEIVDGDWEPMRTVEGQPLSDEELQRLLARVPTLEERDEDVVEFKRRADSLPPPITGDQIEGEWPPDLSSPAGQPSPDGSLKAQAFRPQGEVEPPFQVAVAFDRPVVEVGAVGTRSIPDELEISPDIDGRWRWIGTRTVVFEPTDRWTMATEFEVGLREGVEAVDGTALEESIRFGFTTPAPEVQTVVPAQRDRRAVRGRGPGPGPSLGRPGSNVYAADTPVAVVFNQAIDDESAESISVADDDGEVPVELLEGDGRREAADELGVADADDEERVIAVAPQRDFADDADVEVTVDGPLVSAEGPVAGMADTTETFRVRGAFELQEVGCGRNDCRPGQAIRMSFTNNIDSEAREPEVVAEPAVDDIEVRTSGSRLMVEGDFRPRTDYELTVGQQLVDEFGQTIQGERTGEVTIGSHRPFVAGPERSMVVRSAESSKTLPVLSGEVRQFRVRLYDLEVEDRELFDDFRRSIARADDPKEVERNHDFDVEPVDEKTVEIPDDELHEPTERRIDLSAALDGDETGQIGVIIDRPEPWEGRRSGVWGYWVQVTDLAADVTTDRREVVAAITNLSAGDAVQGADVSIGDGYRGTTDEEGEVIFELSPDDEPEAPMVVEDGGDVLMVPTGGLGHRRASGGWEYRDVEQNLNWFVVDDRRMYRPGETVRIRGWMRRLENTPRSEPVGVGDQTEVDYTVYESRRNEIASGRAQVDGFGGFELDFEVPEEANLGTARIQLETTVDGESESHRHSVEFQEFRRPTFEVGLDSGAGPHAVGQETTWSATASYYAGGAVGDAPTDWSFEESSASWRPPGRGDWQFGQWRPWWSPFGSSDEGGDRQVLPEELAGGVEQRTDAQGRDSVSAGFERPDRGLVRRVESTVSVQDVDRQAWEATDSVVVHPASVYVGLRADSNFVARDEAFDVEALAVGLDGEVVEDRPVEMVLQRRRGRSETAEVETCQLTSGAEPVECSFDELTPGSYQVTATVEDSVGRVAESELGFWVSGRDESGAETVEEDELIVVPGDDEFAVGETAELMVQAPYYPLGAIVEIRRDGRYDRQRVGLTEDDPTVEIDIEESMIPGAEVQILAVGSEGAYGLEHFASGSIDLDVDPGPRTLSVELEPGADPIEPGQQLDVVGEVTDQAGEPVEGAQMLVFGVDESVLALSDYELADPVSAFYPERSSWTDDIRSRAWLLTDEPEAVEESLDEVERGAQPEAMEAQGTAEYDTRAMEMADAPDAERGGDDADAIEVREDFGALGLYRSDLETDADGRIEISEQMPDSLTRYRLMAVAVESDTRFGSGEADVTARNPLMVSPSAPRFANVGDEFDVPVVVHNRTGEDQTVDVGLRATRGLQWTEQPGRRIEIEADDRVELRFSARAATAGDTRIQVAVSAGDYSDAELVELPVLTPATTEAFATYGTIDVDDEDAVGEALKVPADAHEQYGGLEVTTSSTQLQALTDAFIHLVDYPFRAAPQLASRMLSVVALYDVLEAFDAAGLPDRDELDESMDEWTQQLQRLQRNDGGFGFWPGSDESHPFGSAHAALALKQADREGWEVSDRSLSRAGDYLEGIGDEVADYDERAAGTVESYALYVLNELGDVAPRRVDDLVGRYGIEELSLEALGWLVVVAGDDSPHYDRMLERIAGQVRETAATAEFQETYQAGADRILHTSRRTDGVVLDGLLRVEDDHPLIDKVVRGLLADRERGKWANTQENVFILRALRRYFDVHEDVEPNFIARAWLGDDQIAEHTFEGRTTDRHRVDVPMPFLMEGDSRLPVVFQRDGEGRMYYRLGVDYAPKSRNLPAEDQGFSVERDYEGLDDSGDVRRTDEGVEIRAGSRVRVELTMTVPARRYHVALVDWLPAGLEALNPALATTEVDDDSADSRASRGRYGWWGWPWYSHQNMRDERVEAFASRISEGVYTYSYTARATTPGRFVAMPAKAEEMYHPETFGRSATETVTVVDDEGWE